MTIQEAIREAEVIVEGGRRLPKQLKLPGHDKHMEFMETLLAAAKKGAGEDQKTEYDEMVEKSKKLTIGTVYAAAKDIAEVLSEMEGGFYTANGTDRFGHVLEPVLHTALAALRKVQADMVLADVDHVDVPNAHIVTVPVSGLEDKEKILEMVGGDLDKIFAEAAKGKA